MKLSASQQEQPDEKGNYILYRTDNILWLTVYEAFITAIQIVI